MTRIAINEVLQWYRKKKSHPVSYSPDQFDFLASAGDSPHEIAARAEVKASLDGALTALPKRYREVLILRDLEELTAKETAERLDETQAAVKTRLFRARSMLSTAMQGVRVRGMSAREYKNRKAA